MSTNSDKLPSLHFYPGDWWKDAGVQLLDHHHKGIWFEMLLLMFESPKRGYLLKPNGQIFSSTELAKRLALDEKTCSTAIAKLVDEGVCRQHEDRTLFNARMVKDEDIRQKKINAGSEGGKAKAKGKKGSKRASKNVAAPDVDVVDENEDLDIDKYREVTWTRDEVIITPLGYTEEMLILKLREADLKDEEDLPRALKILSLYYHRDKTRISRGCLTRDITADWLHEKLFKLKTAKGQHDKVLGKGQTSAQRAADVVANLTGGTDGA